MSAASGENRDLSGPAGSGGGAAGGVVVLAGTPIGDVADASPRLRRELKSAVSWREDVEVALERLLGSVSPDPVLRPV